MSAPKLADKQPGGADADGKTSPSATDTKQVFVTSSLSMSWQLAVVVLVPLIGGHYLDDKLKTSPWLFLSGIVLALVLAVLIVRRTIHELPDFTKVSPKEKVKS